MSTDLFGEPLVEPEFSVRTGAPKRRDYTPKGYARRPGTGPSGETCKTCDHSCRVAGGGSYFWKCAVIKHRWTGGPGTDIVLKSPACAEWRPKTEPVPPAGYRWIRPGTKFRLGDVWIVGWPARKVGALQPVGEALHGHRATASCLYHFARPI